MTPLFIYVVYIVDIGSLQKRKGCTMKTSSDFFSEQFAFDSTKTLFVGVERECFLTDHTGKIIPIADVVLKHLTQAKTHIGNWGYELSACQLESRCGPCTLDKIGLGLQTLELEVTAAERKIGFLRNHTEVAPTTMPLDIYPDPSGRYQEIAKKMSKDILLAACRIIGTHVHIGMPDHESALRVYNEAVKHTNRLCKLGDKSGGKRMEIYKIVAPNHTPVEYASWQDFHIKAVERGFDSDPRKCWTLIRISKHGTIEFRMFGTTRNIREIIDWAENCHSICKKALHR